MLPEWARPYADRLTTADPIVIDAGECPWCGEAYIHVARDGRAIGRKPPDACCLPAIISTLDALERVPMDRVSGEEARDLTAKIAHLRSLLARYSDEEVAKWAAEAGRRRGKPIPWGQILARARAHGRAS